MEENESLTVPSTTKGEWLATLAKSSVSWIPFAGGAASEVLGAILAPHVEKRKIAWLESLAQKLAALEDKYSNITPENLAHNEVFATMFLQASHVALRNHQKVKLDALRNVVLNSILPNSPNDDLQLMFVNLVDSYTTWHIQLLKFANTERHWPIAYFPGVIATSPEMGKIELNALIENQFVELVGQRSFYEQCLSDLVNRGLMNLDPKELNFVYATEQLSSPAHILQVPSYGRLTSTFGVQFLSFISDPLELGE